MSAKEATGLMAFWADVEADYVAEFRQWHNCEHVPERVGVPGFTVARRYCGIGGAPMFFMTYETEDPGVLSSEPYLARLDDPTPWTRQSVARFRNSVRTIYRLDASAGSPCPTHAPYLLTSRFNVAVDAEGDWLDWCRETYLPELAELDGVYRARLYAVDEAGSGIETSERDLHGAEPAGQKYCSWIELLLPGLPDDPDFQARGAASASGAGGLARCRDVISGVSWLDFIMDAPGAAERS
jgi:hypothetical protein